MINLIRKKNFNIKVIVNSFSSLDKKVLNNHFKTWSYKMQMSDSEKTNTILKKNIYDWVLVDHYGLSEIWEKEVSKYSKVAVIDDLLNKKHFCNLYINYHMKIYRKKNNLLTNSRCKILSGLKYAVINKYYLRKGKKLNYRKNNIFIFMGGVDRKKLALKITKKIKNYFNITVLLGANCNYFDEMLLISKKNKFVRVIKKRFNSLKYFFENYDLVISSAGLSMYEQIYCKTNSLFIPQNEYQRKICYKLSKSKYINYLDSISKINFIFLKKTMKLKKRKKAIVDGLGANRILKELMLV
jgi:spore coat polysaccharide biosynthesis predicted glycosyltransferase SpsG